MNRRMTVRRVIRRTRSAKTIHRSGHGRYPSRGPIANTIGAGRWFQQSGNFLRPPEICAAGALDRAAPGSECPAELEQRADRMALIYKTLDFLSICSPQVREMDEHWVALRGDRVLPDRDDLDPARITRYLPGSMLVDVLWGPPLDFVYRLVGTREAESRGGGPTGQRVADAYFAPNFRGSPDNNPYVP